jgi:Holliday junction resolvase RusA-like endonuclease
MTTALALHPLNLRLDVEPHPQGRPRVTIQNGKPHAYPTAKDEQFREAAQWALKAQPRQKFESGHLYVCVHFYVKDIDGAKRGDVDNYVKSLFDACNGIIWTDDKQVTEVHARVATAPKSGPFITMSVQLFDHVEPVA